MQQPNAPTAHFQQQQQAGPVPSAYPSPAYSQQGTMVVGNFESNSAVSAATDFSQYQLQLYAPMHTEQPNNSTTMTTTMLGGGGGHFLATELTQKASPKGRPGPGRGPKLKAAEQKMAEKSRHENGLKRDSSEGAPKERLMAETGNSVVVGQQFQPLGDQQIGGNPTAGTSTAMGPGQQFSYGPPPTFAPFDPAAMGPPVDYTAAAWNGQMSSAGGGYSLPSGLMPMPGGCLGPDEMGGLGLYGAAASGLMPLPGYELDPYAIWPGGGYYLSPEQSKLIGADGTYSTAATDRYGGPPQEHGGLQPPPTSFYGPLQAIPPSTGVFDTAAFPAISTLPPPPSQLASADQLYGLQNGFNSSAPHHHDSSINGVGGAAPLLQLDLAGQPATQFYPHQSAQQQQPELFGGPLQQQPSETTKFAAGNAATGQSRPPGHQGSSGSSLGKRSAGKAQLKAPTMPGRPSTSAGQSLAERGPSPQEKGAQRKSRSRSIVKDSDDDKSTEERECERRNANNTRERIRVRDINSAFKELARLCCQHMPNVEERNLTKLGTLLRAVELIPLLEKKVEEKNRNIVDPRRECLKQRMEASGPASMSAGPGGCPVQQQLSPFPGAGPSSLLSMAAQPCSSNLQQSAPTGTGGHHFD